MKTFLMTPGFIGNCWYPVVFLLETIITSPGPESCGPPMNSPRKRVWNLLFVSQNGSCGSLGRARLQLMRTTYNAAYALSVGVNDWITPLNANGLPDNTLWVPVTAGGSANITVARALSTNQPSCTLTDTMPFIDIPPARLDGGSGVCLFFRLCATVGKRLEIAARSCRAWLPAAIPVHRAADQAGDPCADALWFGGQLSWVDIQGR